MSETGSCNLCDETVNASDMIFCGGRCNKIFHWKCGNITKATQKHLGENKNLMYMCNECLHMHDMISKISGKIDNLFDIVKSHEKKFVDQNDVLESIQQTLIDSADVQKQNNNDIKKTIMKQIDTKTTDNRSEKKNFC
jgi:hypothetical protein